MRKYCVVFKKYIPISEYGYRCEYDDITITLNSGEKANVAVFNEKLKNLGVECKGVVVVSWSLIEE